MNLATVLFMVLSIFSLILTMRAPAGVADGLGEEFKFTIFGYVADARENAGGANARYA